MLPDDPRVGEVYLSADELAARIRELGAEISRDYDGREPLLIGLLKASLIFLTDLSRAIPIRTGSISSSSPATAARRWAATSRSGC